MSGEAMPRISFQRKSSLIGLDCSRSTIDAYVKAGFLPKPQTISNLRRWDFEEVKAFIRAQNAAKGEARGEDDLYMQGLRLNA